MLTVHGGECTTNVRRRKRKTGNSRGMEEERMKAGGKRVKRGIRKDRDNGGRMESENEWTTRRIKESKMIGTGTRGHPRPLAGRQSSAGNFSGMRRKKECRLRRRRRWRSKESQS